MPLDVLSKHIGGDVVVLTPRVLGDERGFFMETYRADNFRDFGLPTDWVQDNHSRSAKGVLRGLHFQWEPPMSKLMRVTSGAAFLVAVDIRKGSPTLGQWFGLEASADNKKQVYAPYGFARGFCALTDGCEVQYKCTGLYNSGAESGIFYKDPEIGVEWPLQDVQVSHKDSSAQSLKQWLASPLSENITYKPTQHPVKE
ncbi:MAG TPA: dTDP-4-dehydrorhamnose 3,5-epimerase [Acidobacteriaceae bacterium]|jgi:dTDP-4-dehydrorhamnose 3,5-epimerase|nr:dTDP-4-dehydrorhamnose 3,5-epimerase [Acidobacteriaceae bacterium]